MNKSSLRNLAIVFFALLAVLVAVELKDRDAGQPTSGALFPELKDQINAVTELVVEAPGESPLTVGQVAGVWRVSSQHGYPASVAKVSEVLLALADAKILEEKTSNPERYAALGVNEPDAPGSRGIRLTLAGDGFSYGLIVGDSNQSSNRYVRPVGQAASLLIDKNPDLPAAASDWLRAELLDIDTARVSRVSVRHADGEFIEISKATSTATEFEVLDIPADRELSYPTVVNGMAAVLGDLELTGVRPAEELESETVTRFETFDGLRVTVRSAGADDDTWISIEAVADSGSADETPTPEETADESATDSAMESSNPVDTAGKPDPEREAADLNARLDGWQFQVGNNALNQLTRRWDDLLKAADD